MINIYPPLSENQSIFFDSLRACAALTVALAHCIQIFLYPHLSGLNIFIAPFSQGSVMLFFVMSGFLIGKSVQNNFIMNLEFDWLLYFKQRIIRIYPPLTLSLLFMIFMYFITVYIFSFKPTFIPRFLELSFSQIIGCFLFLQGFVTDVPKMNTPFWSLSFEIWYYIIVGLACIKRKFFVALSVMIFILGCILNKQFAAYSMVWFLSFFISFYYFKKIKKLFLLSLKIISLFFILAAVIWVIFFIDINSSRSIAIYNVLIGISFAILIFIYLNNYSFKIQVFPKAASFSYTLYLFHFPIILFIFAIAEELGLNSFILSNLGILFSLFISIVTSKLLSYWVENKKNIYILFDKLSLFK